MHNGSCCVGTLEYPVLSHQWPSSPNGFEPRSGWDLLWPARLVGSSGAWWAQRVDRNGATVSVSACHAPLPAFCRWSFGSMSREIRDVCEGAAIQSGIQLNFPRSLENTVQDGDSRGGINLLHSASTLNRGHSLKKNQKALLEENKKKDLMCSSVKLKPNYRCTQMYPRAFWGQIWKLMNFRSTKGSVIILKLLHYRLLLLYYY